MTEKSIETALDQVRERLSKAENERSELDRTIAAAREEERLLLKLLAIRKGQTIEREITTAAREASATDIDDSSANNFTTNSKHPAVFAVIQELAAAGRSLHISELMRLLHDKRVPIPGAGTQANLIIHLRRDSRLVRPSRGMYALATWGLDDMPSITRPKKRKRRVRSKTFQDGSKQ